MKPQLGDVVQDPAAGTCGFLIAANNYLRQHNDFDSLSDEAQRKYRHLRRIGTPASAEALFKVAELPVADFYKQLAWEVAQGHVKDNQTTLEPGHAAG